MDELRSKLRTILDPLPIDLSVVVGVTIALNISVFLPAVRTTPLLVLLGFVFVCFVPGYAFIAALYPERYREEETSDIDTNDSGSSISSSGSGITLIERLLLSVGCSIIIVPLIGYFFNFTHWGIRLTPVLLSVSGFAMFAAFVAAVRRLRLSPRVRFHVPALGWSNVTRLKRIRGGGRTDIALNVLLAGSAVFFAVTVGYAYAGQSTGDQYSEIYLLSEDGERFVDGNQSTRLEQGQSQEITVGVSNHERRTVNYTIIVVQQDVERDGNDTEIRRQTRLEQINLVLRDGETRRVEQTVTPLKTEEDSRVVWLLYTETVPEKPSVENAEYYVYLWTQD